MLLQCHLGYCKPPNGSPHSIIGEAAKAILLKREPDHMMPLLKARALPGHQKPSTTQSCHWDLPPLTHVCAPETPPYWLLAVLWNTRSLPARAFAFVILPLEHLSPFTRTPPLEPSRKSNTEAGWALCHMPCAASTCGFLLTTQTFDTGQEVGEKLGQMCLAF